MPETLVLLCACGATGAFASGESAYSEGWRMEGRDTELCPRCSATRDNRARKEAVTKYGTAAVRRAEQTLRIIRERKGE